MAGITDRQRPTGARSPQAVDQADLDLAKAVADFTLAFERWSRSIIEADAPSFPRLKLLYALHCEGSQRMGDLADALQVTPRSVTALVDGLEAQGQVRRVPDPEDARAKLVRLTARGRNYVAEARRAMAAVESRARRQLGWRRYQAFRTALEELAGEEEQPDEE